jgi:hypothetical protein
MHVVHTSFLYADLFSKSQSHKLLGLLPTKHARVPSEHPHLAPYTIEHDRVVGWDVLARDDLDGFLGDHAAC